jgi:patatin-like phospholipase/acyl hydrolase
MASQALYRRPRAGATLLSLDGGGVKGISSLLILQRIMDRVREIEGRDLKTERLPKDYFDLAGGTSTGGLAALMLFRLNMPTSTVIGHYRTLAATVFAPTINGHEIHKYPFGYSFGKFWLWVKRFTKGSAFSAGRLEQAIDKVTEALPQKGETKLSDNSGKSGRM